MHGTGTPEPLVEILNDRSRSRRSSPSPACNARFAPPSNQLTKIFDAEHGVTPPASTSYEARRLHPPMRPHRVNGCVEGRNRGLGRGQADGHAQQGRDGWVMTLEQAAQGVVEAVVVYDGRLLLVNTGNGWELPSGAPELAETAQATAARVVYELTGYLVDGSALLRPEAAAQADARSAVVCQLLSEDPSADARLTPEQLRWTPLAEANQAGLPEVVREYLEGHTPV